MNDKLKIAMVAVDLSRTGISTVIMNYCRNIDLTRCQIDLIVGNRIVPEYRKECDALGVRIIEVPFKLENAKGYYLALFKNLSAKKYDIVHVHGNSAMITPELAIAWLKGIKVRIAHSHNTTCEHVKVEKILRPVFNMLYTHGFACSTAAGHWLFGDNDFYVIPNGFETEKFKFSQNKRDEIRSQLNLSKKFVIGHIGQFNAQKNHQFLLRVFTKIAEQRDDAVLLLIGNGPDKEKIMGLIDEHTYKDRIIVYGESDHPEDLYCAMDRFVFPSKFEGLGIVLLEAQISGLACVASDVVPSEAIISDNVTSLSLNDSLSVWANNILQDNQIEREHYYARNLQNISKYDITVNARQLINIYNRCVRHE